MYILFEGTRKGLDLINYNIPNLAIQQQAGVRVV